MNHNSTPHRRCLMEASTSEVTKGFTAFATQLLENKSVLHDPLDPSKDRQRRLAAGSNHLTEPDYRACSSIPCESPESKRSPRTQAGEITVRRPPKTDEPLNPGLNGSLSCWAENYDSQSFWASTRLRLTLNTPPILRTLEK